MGEWAEDKRVDVWIYGCMMYTLMDRQVGKLTGGCMDGWMDGWLDRQEEGWKDVWEDGWMAGWLDRWTEKNRWVDIRMERRRNGKVDGGQMEESMGDHILWVLLTMCS